MKAVVLNTSQLRAGDRIKMHGATVLLEGDPVTWSTPYGAGIVYSWQDLPIIKGEIDMFPWMRTWTIQGSDLAHWVVERD